MRTSSERDIPLDRPSAVEKRAASWYSLLLSSRVRDEYVWRCCADCRCEIRARLCVSTIPARTGYSSTSSTRAYRKELQ